MQVPDKLAWFMDADYPLVGGLEIAAALDATPRVIGQIVTRSNKNPDDPKAFPRPARVRSGIALYDPADIIEWARTGPDPWLDADGNRVKVRQDAKVHRAVLDLAADGVPADEIARRVNIRPEHVRTYLVVDAIPRATAAGRVAA